MDREMAHTLFVELMKQRKYQYSMSEMAIILTSQYYNIVDLDKLIPELDPNDYDIHKMRREILSICESFQNNLKLVNEKFSWGDKNEQISSVKKIKKSCLDFLNR